MISALAMGTLLGLSAGLSPGPLMTLVISQTLRYGSHEGCKIALAPLLTDAPIILLALALAARVAELDVWFGLLSLAGAAFVGYLAYDAFRSKIIDAGLTDRPAQSWFRGVATNFLSPHPWLFWMTVGASSLARARGSGWPATVGFLVVFYIFLVGSKLLLVLAASRAQRHLAGRYYLTTMKILGGLLALFGLLLFGEGLAHLRAALAVLR